jgi:tetratricopeptide (TPR) repeat protein
MKRLTSVLLLGLLAAVPAMADTVFLNDGTKLEGDVKKNNEGWVVIGDTGKMTYDRPDQVKSIQMAPATGPSAVQDRITTLRRSVENVSDLKTIIDRYEKFIATAPDPESKKMAILDLADWHAKQDRGMVKLGNQWVDAAEKAKVQEQSLALAAQARDYMKQGRLKEADPILQQAITTDPNNASAHYLRGILLYRQDQFPQARKEFETTLNLVPDHGPTLNNLAVTLYQQQQMGAAFHQFDRAMVVAPNDKLLMTNVAEALDAQRDLQKNSDSYRRAARRFDTTIVALDARQAQDGQYRWGSGWVSAADLEKLKAAEQANKQKLDELAVEFDATQARVTQIDQNIDDNNQDMQRMERDRLRYDSAGRLVQTQLPSTYYRKSDQNQTLLAQRAQEITKLEKIRTQARAIERQLPVPRFTGQLQLYGPEGTPIVPVVDVPTKSTPTTAPSTQPNQ